MKTTLLLLAAATVLFGCGRGTETGKVFVPGTGHPAAWVSHLSIGTTDFHGTAITSVPPASTGPRLFVLHCSPCHGKNGAGKIGPNIQASTLPFIVGAVSNLPIMRGHAGLSLDELLSIAEYIETLATNSNPLAGSFTPVLCTQCHGSALGGGIALVSCFSCHNGPDGSLGHPAGWSSAKETPAAFHGSYGRNFSSGCATCHGVDLNGGFVFLSNNGTRSAPGCSSCHNGVIAPSLASPQR